MENQPQQDAASKSQFGSINFNTSLPLQPWNESLALKSPAPTPKRCTPSKAPWRLQGTAQRTPVSAAKPKNKTPGWSTRRVVAGSTPARKPVQLSTRFFETPHKESMTASSLTKLPNATHAAFWLRKAQNLQQKGDVQGAREALQDALKRDVRPATDITKALAALDKADYTAAAHQTPTTGSAESGAAAGRKTVLWPSLQGAATGSPGRALLPTPDTRVQHFETSNRRESQVRFCTPESNVVAHATSPRTEGINIRSAGSTPFRARPSDSDDEDIGSDGTASIPDGSETPGTQMRRVVVPILEETITDMAEPSPAARLSYTIKPLGASRFLSESMMSPSTGAVHLTPAGGLPPFANDFDQLRAISPRSEGSACSDDSTQTERDETPANEEGHLTPAATSIISFADATTAAKQAIPEELDFAFNSAVQQSKCKTPVLAAKSSVAGVEGLTGVEGADSAQQPLGTPHMRPNVLFNITPSTTSSSHAESSAYTPSAALLLPAPTPLSEPSPKNQEELKAAEQDAPIPSPANSPDAGAQSLHAAARMDAEETTPQARSLTECRDGYMMSPELLGFSERAQAVAKAPKTPVSIFKRQVVSQPSPLSRASQQLPQPKEVPQTPKSAIRRPPLAAEPASLSKPLRVNTPSSRPRPRVGRNELKSLLGDGPSAEHLQHLGSTAALSPMRAPAGLRDALGAEKVVVTPVRRSARKSAAPPAPASSVLRQSRYSFMPNAALERRLGSEAIREPEAFQNFCLEDDDAASREASPVSTLQLERLAISDISTNATPSMSPSDAHTPLAASQDPKAPKSTRKMKGRDALNTLDLSDTGTQGRRVTRSTASRPSMSPTEASIRDTLRTASSKHA